MASSRIGSGGCVVEEEEAEMSGGAVECSYVGSRNFLRRQSLLEAAAARARRQRPNHNKRTTKGSPAPRVAVIGAGVAGCAVAGALRDYGLDDFVVFDAHERPGGLWSHNYPKAQVQSTFELYEYPGKKYPPHIRNRKDPPAPTADEVCAYLEEYIQEKGIADKFVFSTTVNNVLCDGEHDWIIELEQDRRTLHFDFVVVCNGLVSCKPNMIHLPGQHEFQRSGGIVMHSSERRSDQELMVGNDDNSSSSSKRVLVIGNGKSAVDAATAAAELAARGGANNNNGNSSCQPPLQLARRQTWYVPRNFLGILHYKWAFHTRLGSALLPRYFECNSLWLRLLHVVFCPIKWIVWRLVELLLLFQFRLPYRLWPRLGTIEGAALHTSVLITDERHLQRLRRGEIDMRVGAVERLQAGNKALLKDGTVEDVDVVILATGWKLAFDLFFETDAIFEGLNFDRDRLDFCHDGLWLYRNVLPAGFRGMAFVGSNTLTFMNIFTAYVQAYWLAQLLAGDREWPTEQHMKETLAREKAFKRKYYPESEMRAASIEAYMQHYHDVLFREMKARSPYSNCLVRPIANLLVPVLPSTMEGCLEPAIATETSTPTSSEDEAAKSCSTSERNLPEAARHMVV